MCNDTIYARLMFSPLCVKKICREEHSQTQKMPLQSEKNYCVPYWYKYSKVLKDFTNLKNTYKKPEKIAINSRKKYITQNNRTDTIQYRRLLKSMLRINKLKSFDGQGN